MMFHLGSILWILLIGVVIYLVLARKDDPGCGCKPEGKEEGEKSTTVAEGSKKLESR